MQDHEEWIMEKNFNLQHPAAGFPGGSMVKNLPAMWETQVWPLDGVDPLEKKLATHSNILCLENPLDKGAWWAIHSVGSQASRHDWATFTFPAVSSAVLLFQWGQQPPPRPVVAPSCKTGCLYFAAKQTVHHVLPVSLNPKPVNQQKQTHQCTMFLSNI